MPRLLATYLIAAALFVAIDMAYRGTIGAKLVTGS